MKKTFVILVLALTAATLAQPAPAQTSASQSTSTSSTNTKVIKDAAEYNAYMAALNTQDPATRAAAFEAFINQYPDSVVKLDAMEQAMAAYQQAGNQAKVESSARTILGTSPNNIRALAILAYLDRAKATQGDTGALKEGCDYAQKGLQALPAWPKPEGVSDADFDKLRNQMSEIFNGVAGFCALQAKDYPTARGYYLKSFQIDPANMQDIYQFGIVCLQMEPMDVSGFWYLAKAINLATAQNNARAAQGIAAYAKAQYRRYHGSEEGWDQYVTVTATQTGPGVADPVKPKPSNCDIAAEAVAKNSVDELSFSDWEFILEQRDCGPQGREVAEKVWQAIQAKQKDGEARLRIPVKIIAATKETLDVAVTDDNQRTNTADMHVVLLKPLLHPPAIGSTTDVIGIITTYTPKPFMFTMAKGAMPSAEPPIEPPHHSLVHHEKAQPKK